MPAPRSCRNRAHELSAALVSSAWNFSVHDRRPCGSALQQLSSIPLKLCGSEDPCGHRSRARAPVCCHDPYAEHVVLHAFTSVPSVVSCAFNWFTTTLVNYLPLVALVDLMATRKWKSVVLVDPRNHRDVKTHCTDFVRNAVPEVYRWRNKVAAHFAATDPFRDDNLGTIEQSIMNPVSYRYPTTTWARGS